MVCAVVFAVVFAVVCAVVFAVVFAVVYAFCFPTCIAAFSMSLVMMRSDFGVYIMKTILRIFLTVLLFNTMADFSISFSVDFLFLTKKKPCCIA